MSIRGVRRNPLTVSQPVLSLSQGITVNGLCGHLAPCLAVTNRPKADVESSRQNFRYEQVLIQCSAPAVT